MKNFETLKEQIIKADEKTRKLNLELHEKYVVPNYNDLSALKILVYELPDGITKYMAYARIAELENNFDDKDKTTIAEDDENLIDLQETLFDEGEIRESEDDYRGNKKKDAGFVREPTDD